MTPALHFAALTPEGWAIVVSAIGVAAVQLLGVYLTYRAKKDEADRNAQVAAALVLVTAKQAEDAKVAKEERAEIIKTGEENHRLLNSGALEQKRLLSIATRALANITKEPKHIREAEQVDIEYVAQKTAQEQRHGQVVVG